MTRRWLLGTSLVTGMLWLIAAPSVQGAKPAADLPVWVDFGTDTVDSPRGVSGDGQSYFNGVANVRAVMLGNDSGNFVFDTNDNTRIDGGRRLVLNFHNQLPTPLPPGISNGAFSVDVFLGTIGVTGTTADGNLRDLTPLGGSLQRRTRIGWDAGTVSYSLRWDTTNGDGLMNFECVSGSPCMQWRMTNSGNAGLYSIATAPSKGKLPTETFLGSYNMPVSALLTAQ